MTKELVQLRRVAKAALAALEGRGKSVEYARHGVVDEAFSNLCQDPELPLCLFGIKDTDQISSEIIQALKDLPGYIFHTVDKMAPGGRALDPNLVNPLTGRVMTGSSSASCINILLGVNDLAVGTDGGGSVLAPALATGLYSIMAKGLGLQGNRTKISTDSIQFVPGLGIISHSYQVCLQAVSRLAGIAVGQPQRPQVAVIEPGEELSSTFQLVLDVLSQRADVQVYADPSCPHRRSMLDFVQKTFAKVPLILSFEGPVDLWGYGDSVLGGWGRTGQDVQNSGGKGLLKIANMAQATAVGIPVPELGCGALVMAAPGREAGSAAMAVGAWLAEALPRPKLFEDYFIRGWSRSGGGYI